jgi:hypothetical protein
MLPAPALAFAAHLGGVRIGLKGRSSRHALLMMQRMASTTAPLNSRPKMPCLPNAKTHRTIYSVQKETEGRAADTGMKKDGTPDMRTKLGKKFEEAKVLKKDGTPDVQRMAYTTAPMNSRPEMPCLPNAEMPTAVTGMKKDGTPDMRTKLGKQIEEAKVLKKDGTPDMRTNLDKQIEEAKVPDM